MASISDKIIDKYLGMLRLGAYGDALGAPHEARALKGELADAAAAATRLPEARSFYGADRKAEPWGVWLDGADLPADARGVVTDDTACRVNLVHAWLRDALAEAELPDEAGFAAWLDRLATGPSRDEDEAPWHTRRWAQAQAWRVMLGEAKRWTQAQPRDPAQFERAEGNPFFHPARPVVCGLFLYLEAAAIEAGRPMGEVVRRYERFSSLDVGIGCAVTGVLAGGIADAVTQPGDASLLGAWWLGAARQAAAELLHPAHRRRVAAVLDRGEALGRRLRGADETAYLAAHKAELFDPLSPASDPMGLAVFSPQLFLLQLSAAAGYAGGDAARLLRVLAAGPGDCDTLASMMGSMAGAYLGAQGVQRLGDPVASDVGVTERQVVAMFGVELGDIAATLAQWRARQASAGRLRVV